MRLLVATLLMIVLLAAVWWLPVAVPHEVTVPGRLLPAREWLVVRSGQGGIETLLQDHATGRVDRYQLNRFEQGDAIQFQLRPDLRPGAVVQGADTVASIMSTEAAREVARLSGEVGAALALLDLFATGEKDAVINEARMALSRSEEYARQNRRELERLETLHRQGLIAVQELEVVQSRQRVLEADVAVDQARLDAARSGAKPEQIDLTKAEIAALQQEMAALNDRINLYTLAAPFTGVVVRSFSADTLLAVQDTASYVVVMPVPYAVQAALAVGQEVGVALPTLPTPLTGRILQRGDVAHLLQGREVVLVTATIVGPGDRLLTGLRATCTLRLGEEPLRTFLLRTLRRAFG